MRQEIPTPHHELESSRSAAGLCETWTVDRHPLASVGTLVRAAHGVRDRRRLPKLLGAPYRRQPAHRIWDNHMRQVFENARRRCLGGNWIGQKKDKSGKRKAADPARKVRGDDGAALLMFLGFSRAERIRSK
jgi:hypothetical protein